MVSLYGERALVLSVARQIGSLSVCFGWFNNAHQNVLVPSKGSRVSGLRRLGQHGNE